MFHSFTKKLEEFRTFNLFELHTYKQCLYIPTSRHMAAGGHLVPAEKTPLGEHRGGFQQQSKSAHRKWRQSSENTMDCALLATGAG